MDTINTRIAEIVKSQCHGNRSAFARELGLTPAFAAQLCAGQREPSDRTISDICRIFDVREEWLRHGLEPMRAAKTRDEEITELVSRALNGSNEFKKAVIHMICSRTDQELEILERSLREVYAHIEQQKAQE